MARLVGGWVRLYTADLPATTRDARIDEIASDVHEHEHRLGTGQLKGSVFSRWIRGIPSDLAWRAAEIRHVASGRTVGHPILFALVIATAILTMVLNALGAVRSGPMPLAAALALGFLVSLASLRMLARLSVISGTRLLAFGVLILGGSAVWALPEMSVTAGRALVVLIERSGVSDLFAFSFIALLLLSAVAAVLFAGIALRRSIANS